jgi:hypothetical protein
MSTGLLVSFVIYLVLPSECYDNTFKYITPVSFFMTVPLNNRRTMTQTLRYMNAFMVRLVTKHNECTRP